MKKLIFAAAIIIISVVIVSCEKNEQEVKAPSIGFLDFSTNGQTLPVAIHPSDKKVRFEVDHDVDLTSLVPEFVVPDGYTVHVNGIKQVSGSSVVDFTGPVTYELKSGNSISATWQATAVKLSRKILIDASHDGGVWWFPQSPLTGFDQDKPHQGQRFANILRQKGFEVTELGREAEITEEMFFGNYIVIRANGFTPYTTKELEVYSKLLKRGMNMVFFTDHKKYDPKDELADHLGLKFQGIAYGVIGKLKPHMITENLTSVDYMAGSVLTNAAGNPDIEILGWLREGDYADLNMNGVKEPDEPSAPPVMGILNYPKSKIFFIGDLNGLEIIPQPFINNLIDWMGKCF